MAREIHIKISHNYVILIVIFALVVGFVGGYLTSRIKYRAQIGIISTMVMQKASESDLLRSKLNRVMMVDGKMFKEVNGVVSKMTTDVNLINGMLILTTGKVVRKDGTAITLKDGESVMSDGTMSGSSMMSQ